MRSCLSTIRLFEGGPIYLAFGKIDRQGVMKIIKTIAKAMTANVFYWAWMCGYSGGGCS